MLQDQNKSMHARLDDEDIDLSELEVIYAAKPSETIADVQHAQASLEELHGRIKQSTDQCN